MPLKRCSDNGKSGWKWGDQGTCYTGKEGKNQAIKQGVAIEGPEKFAKIMREEAAEWAGKSLYDSLSNDEKELANSLLSLAEKIGPLDKGEGVWVGYEGASTNPTKDIGVKCGNCALHKSENACAILDQEIEMDGACRFAVIPPGLVKTKQINKDIEEYLNEDSNGKSTSEKKM